jgi:hypothetical protein
MVLVLLGAHSRTAEEFSNDARVNSLHGSASIQLGAFL